MLLTITTTRAPATDLGYLLHKHPDRPQSFATSAGEAHVFYPEATPERCTAALLLEVDPIALVRGPAGKQQAQRRRARPVRQRPAVRRFQHARGGDQGSLPHRADRSLRRPAGPGRRPHPAHHQGPGPALPRRRAALAHRVFAPLGWSVDASSQPLQPAEWGDSPYLDLRLTGELRLADALNHLYVLLPVLDDAKHYWVSTEEVDKLIRAGGDWLAGHPEKELITRRYLSHQQKLTRSALARLAEADDTEPEELDNAVTEEDAPKTSTSRWRSSAARPSWPSSAKAARAGSATSAAAPARSPGTCSPTPASSTSPRSTCPPGRCSWPPATSSSTRCPITSASG